MFSSALEFLILINPFALFLYLAPLMKELSHKQFLIVLLEASLISFIIFLMFLLGGNFIFQEIFGIDFESFRLFGGIIIFTFAFLYIVRGDKAFIRVKDDIKELPPEIALPFMVGAGTISLAIIYGQNLGIISGSIVLLAALFVNYIIIILLKIFRDRIPQRIKLVFDRGMDIFLRLNGFFVGAIGVEMVRVALNNIYF